MLSLGRSPAWRTVAGGSKTYVEQIAKQITSVADRLLRCGPCGAVAGGVEITGDGGQSGWFDAAVVATHPDQALAPAGLADPCRARGARRLQVLHRARWRCIPTRRCCRAARPSARPGTTCSRDCAGSADEVHVSYYLNRLQRLSEPADYIVTLNPLDQVRPALVLRTMTYRAPALHPAVSSGAAAAARARTPTCSPTRAPTTAGASTRTAAAPAVTAAAALGVRW